MFHFSLSFSCTSLQKRRLNHWAAFFFGRSLWGSPLWPPACPLKERERLASSFCYRQGTLLCLEQRARCLHTTKTRAILKCVTR